TARFVMFKVPFEDILSPVIFQEIEESTERMIRPEFRVCALRQRELYEEGLPASDKEGRKRIATARYEGNKWGGKYLRAPDIFFTILEKGKGKLVRLGDIAEVRRGFTTGADGWFHVRPLAIQGDCTLVESGDGSKHLIETKFLLPIVRSLKECKKYRVTVQDLPCRLVAIDISRQDLSRYHASEYVHYGEITSYPSRTGGGIPAERPTCAARREWYRLNIPSVQDIRGFMFKLRRDKHFVADNQSGGLGDDALYEIYCEDKIVVPLLNSSITALFMENIGRTPGGGSGPLAIMVVEAKQLLVLQPSAFTSFQRDCLLSAFEQMANREVESIFDETNQPDRRALDDVIFDVLGLTGGEREAVYEAVVGLVKGRLEKAKSV
ncbi:MAG: hypothetical protein ACE5PV_14305, partial [Candidatus Poribacteria bacterium]